MCLIVGLGNPGKKYERTRHNVGFLVLDELVNALMGKFKNKQEVKSNAAEVNLGNKKIVLLKPETFMNLSGDAVVLAAKKWRLSTNKITVIVDDANLPLGTIRTRTEGSSGGHNGLRSVIEKTGTDEIRRIRIGIGRPEHPDTPLDKWVLEKFNKEEWKTVVESARLVTKKIINGEISIG